MNNMREITDKQILLSPMYPYWQISKDRFDHLIQELGPDSGSDCYLG